MHIVPWLKPDEQVCRLGRHQWSVARLIELARKLPVLEVPLDHLCVYYRYDRLTLREMAMHMKAVINVDMSFPIILDEDGQLLDGRHRLMAAMVFGYSTVKVVRFEENPYPCVIHDEET